MVIREILVALDRRAYQESRVTQDLLEDPDPKDLKDPQDPQEKMESQDSQG
jgi:hypothetical protein